MVLHHLAQLGGGGIPVFAVFQHQKRHVVEVLAQDLVALGLAFFGETQGEVDLPDFAAGGNQPVAYPAEQAGERAQGGMGELAE